MRYLFITFLLISIVSTAYSQDGSMLEKGVVSYVSSQNVYVKFETTENIAIGDTLFIANGSEKKPFLVVTNKSSISCVATPLTSESISVSDELIAKKITVKEPVATAEESQIGKVLIQTEGKSPEKSNIVPSSFRGDKSLVTSKSDLKKSVEKEEEKFKQKIKGRISAASYSNLSDSKTSHRMRYTFSLRGDHLGNSRFSIDNYITFRHTIGEWDEVKNNLSRALRVYSLALKYDFNNTARLTVGRKINPEISSMGAIDGIQLEKGLGDFRFGAIVGSRPDYTDYGLNLDLFQFGGYVNHSSANKNKYQRTTLAFIEQRNNSKIDRRFLYFQHNSSLVKNLSLFTSFEMALYEKINNESKNILSLTNLYASLRYRFSRRLNLSASYDTRKNLIYYESYKSFIDKLIEEESRQGVRFHLNYRPFKRVTWGVNTGWRFQKSNKNLSKNLNTYLSFSQIAGTNVRAYLTANLLQTSYLDSKIFGIRVSNEIIPGILTADLNYRMVDYHYNNYETTTHQNIGGVNFSMRMAKKLTFYVYYEGTFDNQDRVYHRFNTKIIQRF